MAANDTQVGGEHYKTGGEEHWDRVHRLGLDYFQAQITKYVERCWKKNGLEDLKKARHVLDKYIELHTEEKTASAPLEEPAGGGGYRIYRGPGMEELHLPGADGNMSGGNGAKSRYINTGGPGMVGQLDEGYPGKTYVNPDEEFPPGT